MAVLAVVVVSGCGPDAVLVAQGSATSHSWRYELVDGLPRWIVDGEEMSRTLRNPQFAPASPHLSVSGGWFHIDDPFVQVSVHATADVNTALLVVDGAVVEELSLTRSQHGGEVRQHAAAAVADRGVWSAVVACRNGHVVGYDYAWLPDGLPEWTPADELCPKMA